MRLHRFYTKENLAERSNITLSDEGLIHQIRDVFRLTTNDKVILFCGDGSDYVFGIRLLSKKELELVKESSTRNFIPGKKVTLIMSLIKKDNFEMVLEKCTELGVSYFVPVVTERVQKKNIDMVRANKIIKEASEQCGRGDIPMIDEIMSLEEVLEKYPDLIVFDMDGSNLNDYKFKTNDYNLLIGPEGGWSEGEIKLFKEKSIPVYKLGETTLRAETAAIVASSFVLQ